ncbi:MAG TPA: PAS domain S-box protein [Chloroflexi bacterium]|nr:PAS domain S-box protein [Chloroflexota bacterium]
MRLNKRILQIITAAGISVWLLAAGMGIILTRSQPGALTEMLVYSMIVPVLVASFAFGRGGGMLAALLSSLISASLAMGQPEALQSPLVQRVLFQIIFFNIVALVTSGLSEREKKAAKSYRDLFDGVPVGLYRAAVSGQILNANQSLVKMLGYPNQKTLLTVNIFDLHASEETRRQELALLRNAGLVQNFSLQLRRYDGTVIWAKANTRAIYDIDGQMIYYEGSLVDVTRQMQLEDQLHQAQKMEAVGRLAGGIAHDFNNIMTAIIGYSSLLLMDMSPSNPLYESLEQIKLSGERAASLTHQLLAFSRKQMLQPQAIDLNKIVANAEEGLRRLMGEDIALITRLSPDLKLVKADPVQIELVITNLATNAQAAMPDGGKLIIETANAAPDEDYAAQHPNIAPGKYVMLLVGDTGRGMDAETQANIFEPFFTTKEVGQGPGLGLSIIHGIIAQSGGHIQVNSKLGQGAVFKIYLPQVG